MKIKHNITTVLTVILGIILLTSCDFLLPGPLGRDNPEDDGTQIGGFASAVSGSNSIIVVWDWHPPAPDIPDYQVIDKVRIVYSENDIPSSMYPINKDEYTEVTSNTTWQFEWKNLRTDKDHYFALYAHEKGGSWLSPIFSKRYININGFEERTNMGFTKLYVNTSGDANPVTTTASNITASPLTVFFLVFDFPSDDGAVLDARLTSFSINNTGTVDVVPVRKRVNDGMQWGDINNPEYYDYTKALHIYIGGNADEVQIKDQVNAARMYGSDTVAFIPDSGSPINMAVNITEFYNGSDDLFSMWRNNY